MLISEDYRQQNKQLHESNAGYGVRGWKWAEPIRELANQFKVNAILDYGCGKQTLKRALPEFNVIGYDPAIEGVDTPPEPSKLVVCTDVLEHIEPELIDDVLDDLRRVTLKAAFLVVAMRPAKKVLPDGRNAHLIQKPLHWWIEKLESRFNVNLIQNLQGKFMALVMAK